MSRLMDKEIGGVKLLGYSVAGEEAVIALPEHNVCFDVGRAPREIISIDNVCLTHGHMDHAAGVAYYFSQRGFVDLPAGQLIVHRGLAQALQRLMDVWSDIERNPSLFKINGVVHLEEVELRRGLFVRAFTTNHTDTSLGFSLIERRHKLKPELIGKTGPELVDLKKQGIAIEDETEVILATYTGDTALGRFLELDFVKRSQVLLVECTFFDDDHRSRARAGRHIHADDVPKVCAAVPDARIVLTHVTRRTDMRSAKRVLQKIVAPQDAERVCFFMDRPPRPALSPLPAAAQAT
jgi:ribonuclease Z